MQRVEERLSSVFVKKDVVIVVAIFLKCWEAPLFIFSQFIMRSDNILLGLRKTRRFLSLEDLLLQLSA